jgi:hypothetical protein
VARILGIHGIWNMRYYTRSGMSDSAAEDAISRAWSRALTIGLNARADLRVCYYAHHLNRGTPQSRDDPDLLEPGAQDILIAWMDLLNGGKPVAQGTRTVRARGAADWMSTRFPHPTRLLVLAFCRELHTYQAGGDRRKNAMQALRTAIDKHKPEVLVAHSLGSVVAYETLWQDPFPTLDCLVTLGSPLAMPVVVFDRLQPVPVGGRGSRPPGVRRWVNIADVGDIVAVPPYLAERFAGVEKDVELTLGNWSFHAARDYLSTPEVRAVLREFLDPKAGRFR